jgi:hypothetical protein
MLERVMENFVCSAFGRGILDRLTRQEPEPRKGP